jgi:predicted Zn-dependent protease with MMP-like domain
MTDPTPLDDDAFGDFIQRAIDDLPEAFRVRLDGVAIVVEDEPTADQLRSVGAAGLFGLYQGVPRTRWAADSAPIPTKITIFRGPLERAHRTPARLEAAVGDTVRHEIAHHFGIDDARLRDLQRDRR